MLGPVQVHMDCEQLKQRTKQFALRIIRLIRALPTGLEARVIANQLLRSATSMAANYRAACLARSPADFVSKVSIALEEADESVFWLELLIDAEIFSRERLKGLLTEGKELTAIFAASRLTANERKARAARSGT